jgi:hypothetical protein
MDHEAQACRNLWSAVVHTALTDALTPLPAAKVRTKLGRNRNTTKSEQSRRQGIAANQRKARSWLTSDDTDFRFVCGLAGLDPNAMLERTRVLAARGWPLPPKPKRAPRSSRATKQWAF